MEATPHSAPAEPIRVRAIDSHTEGEPTRVIVEGGPVVDGGTLAEKREDFRRRHDRFRRAVIEEPRGNDVLVGALLVEPTREDCAAGVVFFNNAGFLSMCGHGMIGFAVTLGHLGRIGPGTHRIETPAGVVAVTLGDGGRVTIDNVPSWRHAAGVVVEVEGHGPVRGDVAWGGNWFFLTSDHGLELELTDVDRLTDFAWRLRVAVSREYPDVDHIELVGPPRRPDADARNFVLCPGRAYDRSPCGTGTSAKMACLFADGKLAEGRPWRQESIIGSLFEGSVRRDPAEGQGGGDSPRVIPTVTGAAFVTAESTLVLDPADPFCWGIGSPRWAP